MIPTTSETPKLPTKDTPKSAPPATDRQKEYAQSLGIEFNEGIDRKTISKMIDAAVQKQDDERFQRLDELQDRENEAYLKLREEIENELNEEDPRLSKATEKQMMEALGERGTAGILLTFGPKVLEKPSLVGGSANVYWTSCYLEQEKAYEVLKQTGFNLACEENPEFRKLMLEDLNGG